MTTPSGNVLDDIHAYETAYLENLESVLVTISPELIRYHFLGIVFRGLLLKGGRDHRCLLSTSALNRLTGVTHKGPVTVEHSVTAFKSLADLYLLHFGTSRSINNMILEIEHNYGDRRAKYVQIQLNAKVSEIVENKGARVISVSQNLCQHLCGRDKIFDKIINLLRSDRPTQRGTHNLLGLLRKQEPCVASASSFLYQQEIAFAWDLSKYTLCFKPVMEQVLPVVQMWMRALQGLLLLSRVFGCYWVTVPFYPQLQENLESLVDLPLCALTVLGDNTFNAAALHKDWETRVNSMVQNRERRLLSGLHDRLLTATDQQNKVAHEIFPALADSAASSSLAPLRNLMKYSSMGAKLLVIGAKLVGAKHEGDPLSFTLLCAPDSVFVGQYSMSGGRSEKWSVIQRRQIQKEDFPPKGFEDNGTAVIDDEVIINSIKANALLLQEPGSALLFPIIAISSHPHAIVEFVPFDPQQIDRTLEAFTERSQTHIAIRVREKDAILYCGGKQIAKLAGGKWNLHEITGEHSLKDALLQRTGLKDANLTKEQHCRLLAICNAAVAVKRREYGALFFVDWGSGVTRLSLAPVWGSGRSDPIEDVLTDDLAAAAGLDGEVYADLRTGRYNVRQFVQPAAKNRFEVLTIRDGAVTWGPKFKERWRRAYASKGKFEMDKESEVYSFGTRHQKAMRVTWGYKKIAAITVSSNGTIRVWSNGIPVAKFDL